MQILRHNATQFHEWCISSVTFTSAHLYGNVYMRVGVARMPTNSSNYELLGEQSSPKWEIPCLGHRWTTVQNMTQLALIWINKQAKNKQTVTNISTPCLLACVDNKTTDVDMGVIIPTENKLWQCWSAFGTLYHPTFDRMSAISNLSCY